ncbi:hypothetical protein CVT25_011526 [Psilocybe cyanescens]|uniref:Uncharacterized protein n=1 Tax=Psilocybe cyanescens TaxID=93625 RepID=A0A409XUS7_PSICY|nr:hypothetical protein CVT25_011526 [Psilocybe cyanescens]
MTMKKDIAYAASDFASVWKRAPVSGMDGKYSWTQLEEWIVKTRTPPPRINALRKSFTVFDTVPN